MTEARLPLRLALPKGRMQDGVFSILAEAGIQLRAGGRSYRPRLSVDGFEVKLLKPQNIVEMLHEGSRDLGFAGTDWVQEMQVDLVRLVDTRLDPVRLVAAAPENLLEGGRLPERPLVVASEYERLTREWIRRRGQGDHFVPSHGATEVFPPEDADCIVDNTATGSTLKANDLVIVDELMRSSTCLYANPRVMENTALRPHVDNLVLLLDSVLMARDRFLLEVNVNEEVLDAVIQVLGPGLRAPTMAPLRDNSGFAIRVAVLRPDLPDLIPRVKAAGGTDLVVTHPKQIVP